MRLSFAILHNVMKDIGGSIAFRLRGHKSNRDAIGAAITRRDGHRSPDKVSASGLGFLAQHSKEVFFGVGKPEGGLSVRRSAGQVALPRSLKLCR